MKPDKTLNYERQIEIPLLKDYCLKQKRKGLKRVFDIGGSESTYLGWLLENSFEVAVLDPCNWPDNQTWPEFVGHENFKIIKRGIEDYPVTSKVADFALLISVLEHLGRGGYRTKTFDQPEVTCFKNIQVPFLFTTPAGEDHEYGNPPDKNYSDFTLDEYLKLANKQVESKNYYVAPDWDNVKFNDIKHLRYAQLLGNGASAIGAFEIA